MATLLGWMRDGQNGNRIQWEQVMELIAAVREQLGLSPRATTHRYTVPAEPARKFRMWMIWAGMGVLAAGCGHGPPSFLWSGRRNGPVRTASGSETLSGFFRQRPYGSSRHYSRYGGPHRGSP